MTRKIFFQRKNIFLCMLLLTSAFVYPVEKEAIPQEKPELSHYEKAVDFYKNRDLWLGAISEAKMHLQEHPYHLPSYNLIARVYLEFNEFPKAAEAILTALGKGLSNKESVELMNKVVSNWEKQKNSQEEIVSFYLEIARAYSRSKEYAKANEYYRKYLQSKSKDLQRRLEFARVLSWAKYYSQAVDEYNVYLLSYPQDTKVSLELARIYYWKNDISLAEKEVKKILVTEPKNLEAVLLLCVLYEQQGRHQKAKNEYENVLKLSPNNKQAKAGLERVRILEEKASLWGTVEGMKKVIEETKDYRLYLTLANQLYYDEARNDKRKENLAEAFKYYRVYLEKYPEDNETRARFAEILSWEKKYDEAIFHYRTYLDKYPEEYLIRLELAKMLTLKDDYPPALKELDRVQEADPSLSDIYLWRGNIYRDQNNYEKALESYRYVMTLPYNQYNREAIENILETEKAIGIERRIKPDIYFRYTGLFESVYSFNETVYDLGGRLHLANGSLTLSAGYKEYKFDQAGTSAANGSEMYVLGEGNPKDTFKWSAALSLFSLEPFQTRLSMHAEISWLVSPDTLLGAVLSSRSGIFDIDTLNLYNLGDDLKVDNLDLSYGQKLSDRDEVNATISEGWFSDGNTRDRAVLEYLHRVNDMPLVRIGGEFEYLTFSLDNTNYWAPRPYSSISFVALIDDNDADETFFYRGKAAIGRVIEAAQTELSLDGEVTYNISSNLSAEMVLAVALGSTGDARSTLTSITLGVTYHF